MAATAGGTSITNTATITFFDRNNVAITVASNTIVSTVAAVSSVVVGPNETACGAKTDSVVAGREFVRSFTITNSSNITDDYTIAASVSAGSIVSLAYGAGGASVQLANGAALPGTLPPGGTAQVLVTVDPGQAPVGTEIEIGLSAKSGAGSAVNGQAASGAQQCAIVSGAAVLAGPGGTGTVITKLVNGSSFAQTAPGSTVTYAIAFSDGGGVAATNVVIADDIPAGVTAIPSSVLVNGTTPPAGSVSLTGQTLKIRIASLAPATPETVTFAATLSEAMPPGSTTVNVASISADNAARQTTTAATFLAGTANVVYDGLGGQGQPVAGAVVSLVNATTKLPIVPGGTPFAPNATNADPFATGGNGAYGFGLGPNQIGPVTYLLTVVAPGYENRQIRVTLVPGTGGLYTATLAAEDGRLLARPGGFALTPGPVTLANVYGLLGNIPLFRAQSLTIVKTVDRSFAATGDRLVYSLDFSNVGASLATATVTDTLPAGLFYAPGTGRVDDIPREPVRAGRTLTWSFPTLATEHSITFATVILPGTADYTVLTNVATVRAFAPNDPALALSASSSVDTRIVPGVFTDSTIVTGRVFYDIRGTGYFAPGDVGVAKVRVYLEDGESALTDSFGRYSFPAVKPGMHVLKIDRSSLPPDAHPYADAAYDDERSIRRLVHGVFDGGLIQDVNFALAGAPKS
jgi:uncharacterized repeat protein (TIGR01451 family)